MSSPSSSFTASFDRLLENPEKEVIKGVGKVFGPRAQNMAEKVKKEVDEADDAIDDCADDLQDRAEACLDRCSTMLDELAKLLRDMKNFFQNLCGDREENRRGANHRRHQNR